MIKRVVGGCRKIFIGIIGLILLCAITIPEVYRVVNYTEIERREQNLHSVFQTISHPEGARQLKFSIHSKAVKRWIRAEYTYNMNDTDVEKYYYEELVRQGWIKQSVSEERYKQFHESIYRKDDYEIVFSPSKDSLAIDLNYRDIFDRLGL
jgi:hypothetical protein